MNILIFSEAAWDDKNSFGNTVSNLFCGKVWKIDTFSAFYARKQLPDNKANVMYYNLSATDIIKGIFRLKIKGQKFSSKDIKNQVDSYSFAHESEQKKIDKLHQSKNNFVYFGHELVWRSRLWINRYFKQFISRSDPDILFAFAASPFILWPLIQCVKKYTSCKVVLLIADEVYGNYDRTPLYRRKYLKSSLKKCILSADKLYGISDEMSELYQKRFNRKVTTLYKGCDLSIAPKQHLNKPLRFVYAGNLLWGRDEILAQIAGVIEKQNEYGEKAILEIYTGMTITDELQDKLNIPGTSQIMGSRSYDEIKKIMHDADVVLHVESFNERNVETVRYSFSTKIIDCIQSGAQVLGIGPAGIASIEYIRKVDGAIVADDLNQISDIIGNIIHNRECILNNIETTRKYALEHHEISSVQKRLRQDFENLL